MARAVFGFTTARQAQRYSKSLRQSEPQLLCQDTTVIVDVSDDRLTTLRAEVAAEAPAGLQTASFTSPDGTQLNLTPVPSGTQRHAPRQRDQADRYAAQGEHLAANDAHWQERGSVEFRRHLRSRD